MRYKAVFLDFYGTLVKEDIPILNRIVDHVVATSAGTATRPQVYGRWWELMRNLCAEAYRETFLTQREIEVESLRQVLDEVHVNLDAAELCSAIFKHWERPEPQDGVQEFIDQLRVPVCIVSNIDDADLCSAMQVNAWNFANWITSEQCRSYKPRPEMFIAALRRMRVQPGEVLHIGDSAYADIAGAQAVGIDVAWINWHNHPAPPKPPTYLASSFREITMQIAASRQ